jgi:histone H3/H4
VKFIAGIIEEAEEYVYLSTESFTDRDFSDFLLNTAVNREIEIKILTGTRSMDFTDRVNEMLRDLLAQKIKINTTDKDLHAKLILTDKSLVISSINLNRINLGFYKTKKFWRENTETLFVCRDSEAIRSAKERFLERFSDSYDVENKLAEKLESLVKDMFVNTFDLRSSSKAKKILAKFILNKQIDIRKMIIKIGKLTQRLMTLNKRKTVRKEDIISALILHCLSERKHDYSQLTEKLGEVGKSINLRALLNKLKFAGMIEEEDDFYKIDVGAIIG